MRRRHGGARRRKIGGWRRAWRALAPLLHRVDPVAGQANPYLVAMAIGLGLLYLTCRLTLTDPGLMDLGPRPAMARAAPAGAAPPSHLTLSRAATKNGHNRAQ